MGYVALTMHLWPSNYSIGHKRLVVAVLLMSLMQILMTASLMLDIDDPEPTLFSDEL